MKTCCVTGHRDAPQMNWARIEEELRNEIRRAIDEGFVRFLSGFANGADLLFARLVAEEKARGAAVLLEAAIPYPGRLNTPNPLFQQLIRRCDEVKVHSRAYSKSCYMVRNRYMVDESARVLAVYDGRPGGGTAATVKYAQKQKKEIIRIAPF